MAPAQARPAGLVQQVPFVEREDLREIPGADLAQDLARRRHLMIHVRGGRVGDVEN